MSEFLAYTVLGVVTGSIYAVGASGLVLTYATSGIFNIAHGAIGMMMAFTYWELRVNQGWPAPIALIVVLGILAPLFGALIQRFIVGGLRDASFGTALVVTVGLMVFLIGIAQTIWPSDVGRRLAPFFGDGATAKVLGVFVSAHDFITIATAAGVAAFLWLFLGRTRTGIAMRAIVDDQNLISLNGAPPQQLSMFSWAMGSMLAAAAGILIAPALQLDVLILTFLVINAYAAAMVGRLKSLPLTFVGAIALGLIESYAVGYVPLEGWALGFRPAMPIVFLFVVLVLLPQDRLRAGKIAGAKSPTVPNLRRSVAGAGALVAAVFVLTLFLSDANLSTVGTALALSMVMLSLVLLTGYGGQVSLAQMSFAGLGAFAMAKFGAEGQVLGLIAALLLAGIAGAIVTLPALRLQGLYLALATMAFASFMDLVVFQQAGVFGIGSGLTVGRLNVLGIHFSSEASFVVLSALAFGAMGVLVLAIRRGPFGRLLAAMRDSEVACATLGLSLARTKFAVFAMSASIAGLAGAFLGGVNQLAGATEFQMLQSLPILLMAVVGGITTVTGALIGGTVLALLPVLQSKAQTIGGLVFLLIGVSAVSLGRNPNGIAFLLSSVRLDRVAERVIRARTPEPAPIAGGQEHA